MCQVVGTWFAKINGQFIEVRGHTRHPWNDLADSLARWSACHAREVGHISWTPFSDLLRSGDYKWAWLLEARETMHQCLPPGSTQGSWQLTPSYRKVDEPAPIPPCNDWTCMHFCIASANVLAIGEAASNLPESTPADRAVRLDKQWHMKQIAAVGLQESRREAGRVTSEHYFGFASGGQTCGRSRHFGCELWLHKTLPLDSEGRLTFSDFRPVVVVADPRRLVVNLHHAEITMSFVVLHVPCKTNSCSVDQIGTWWQETLQLLHSVRLAHLTWCMIDANAPLASTATQFYELHGAEPTNPQGLLFEEALRDMQWYAPSTMAWAHAGLNTTWKHPRGSSFRRDYILCSAGAFEWCAKSRVDPGFDSGFSHDDHFPVVLESHGWVQQFQLKKKVCWDRLAFVDPVKCRAFQAAVQSLPIPDWTTHVDSHAAIFQQNLYDLACQFFQKNTKDRFRPRLSEATCNFIQFKRSCLDFGRAQDLMTDSSFRVHLKSLEKEVRSRVRNDQRVFYANLVDELAQAGELHDARTVYKLLTQLGGRKNSKSIAQTLPLLRHNGQPVCSFREQQKLWMKQFAAVEAGNIMARSEFSRLTPANLGLPPEIVSFDVFPDVHELTQQIHRLRRGKAAGPDGIPPDVLKAGSHAVAKHIAVLTTKIAAHGREPTAWRTGKLVPLHKGKLERSNPLGYRSICLNNFTTKLYHSVLRKHLVQAWLSVLTHLQLGGRKGIGCDSAHHLVQAHISFCQVHHSPGAILFVDFKSAFYSVLRQGLFAYDTDDTAFLTAMHRLGVHPQDVAEMLRNAQSHAAIQNMSEHALWLLHDVLRATCFEMEGLSEITATTRGTRPGDPIGDVAFNIVMAALLKDVSKHMTLHGATWEGSPQAVSDFAPCNFQLRILGLRLHM